MQQILNTLLSPSPVSGQAVLVRKRHDDECFFWRQPIDQIIGITMQGEASGLMTNANANLWMFAQTTCYAP